MDTTFPHAKPQMLYWNVQSEMDGEATIEITYFTSGISWSADYIGIADPDESQLNLEGFVRVNNHSGEEYEDAQVRLVVGRVNLVEKIAQLAQALGQGHGPAGRGREAGYEVQGHAGLSHAKRTLQRRRATAAMAGAAQEPEAPKEVAKEGLGEYFIYTIEGTETIPNGWSKRLRSLEAAKVPVKIQYRYRPAEYGENLVRMYLLTNDKESKLGTTPLPDGTFRLFRQNGRDGLSFLAAQSIKYIPIGDKIELNLGADPEVIFELVKLRIVARRHLDAGATVPISSSASISRACRSTSIAPLPAGTTMPCSPSGCETTRRSPSTWRSAARFPATSSFAAGCRRRTTIIKPWSIRPPSRRGRRPNCSTRS